MALLDAYTGSWTEAEVSHLTRRTTFGSSPENVSSLIGMGMSAAVDSIVDYLPTDQVLEDLISNLPSNADHDMIQHPVKSNEMEGWWIYRMVHSSQPFQQQFALFLHDHFVSERGKITSNVSNASNDGNDGSQSGQSCKVTDNPLAPDPNREQSIVSRLMRDQHYLFLTMGHGAYYDILMSITRDPCMLIYLDNRLNVAGKAQENYAREVMELFTMGVGNYSEQDVREMARAFTGETVDTACSHNWPYSYYFQASKHDPSLKTVFGLTFNNMVAGGDTVTALNLITTRISNSGISPAHSVYPAMSLYLSWKFTNWFVNESIAIDHAVVPELAAFFYNFDAQSKRYNVRETLRKLLKSHFFYDLTNRSNIYKHPADFMVMALRNLGIDDPGYCSTAYSRLRAMGMTLFEPPNVAGWEHGKSWINSSSIIARFNYADRLSSSTVWSDVAIDALITQGHIANWDDDNGIIGYFMKRLMLEGALPYEVDVFTKLFKDIKGSASSTTAAIYRRKVRAALHLSLTMPRYQLK